MLIKAGGLEFEIREDAFVCIGNGITSHFCEWSRLDTALQEAFKNLREEMSRKMDDFLRSEENRLFMAVSEKYEDTPQDSCRSCHRSQGGPET